MNLVSIDNQVVSLMDKKPSDKLFWAERKKVINKYCRGQKKVEIKKKHIGESKNQYKIFFLNEITSEHIGGETDFGQ